MCLIAFSFNPDASPYLVLVANRDEFHARSTAPLAWWEGKSSILAGRDLQAGGTWLGTRRDGRWAAVTNVRDPAAPPGRESRGALPLDFLEGDRSPETYARQIESRRADFGPFNLLVGDSGTVWYVSSSGPALPVEPGVHALSNGRLDSPWPKSQRVSRALKGLLASESVIEVDADRWFHLMQDREPAPDEALPDTGVGLEMERFLSSPFILSERYGTRSSSLLVLGEDSGLAIERRWSPAGTVLGQLEYRWPGPSAA
ncbi:NRDE family protein [Wenzhouxiangella marina]|uniref:Uncharacterized protein n=1 Tax=Wenzhouxiangella marina TaxID=1579979 RepID=A0A0K0XUF0_9GAMM|nr:NRDE family protein [Wenzhouxiangella marina]AKS41290.1 hypothetical protein WM2015_909 [Wenzhouxiangella marina]MBB6086960.1 uncharacterized protein with NRDE domain [Wenzhouxiangella marina]